MNLPHRKRMAFAAGLFLFLLTYNANAAEPSSTPTSVPVASPTGSEAPDSTKSPAFAFSLSLAATLAPAGVGLGILLHYRDHYSYNEAVGPTSTALVLIALGLSIGPAAGHFYSGDITWTLIKAGARLLLVVGSGLLYFLAAVYGVAGALFHDDESTDQSALLFFGGTLLALPGIFFVGWDIATAPLAAQRANSRPARSVSVGPLVPSSAHSSFWGVAVSGFF